MSEARSYFPGKNRHQMVMRPLSPAPVLEAGVTRPHDLEQNDTKGARQSARSHPALV